MSIGWIELDLPAAFADPRVTFWAILFALSALVFALWVLARSLPKFQRSRHLTWDHHTQYIDILDFSNRNIPLKVTYKGTEPRWLWATYLYLRNTGSEDISEADIPDKQGFIIGGANCRYIGFNKLLSPKAKVTLSPLFRGNDVYCKVDFDRLGPGDEIVVSLLFVADEKQHMSVEGSLFGANARVVDGARERMRSWRALWWLLILLILTGTVAGIVISSLSPGGPAVFYQLLILMVLYSMALATAVVLLRPIRYYQRLHDRFAERQDEVPGAGRWLRFFMGLSKEP
ncbi:hypothetical protein IT575_10715 [bacterium]|nr:hypothetical protein [bacterium]